MQRSRTHSHSSNQGISFILWSVLLILGLASCNSTPRPPPVPVLPLVGDVSLRQPQNGGLPDPLLDIGIVKFSAAPVNPATAQLNEWLVSEIRIKETHYLPYVLRQYLVQSDQWGAVRVLPAADPAQDLVINGTVLRSDGLNLELRITARDSTGRLWLDRTYADETSSQDVSTPVFVEPQQPASLTVPDDPFSDLYEQIANDLLDLRENLSASQQQEIVQISRLRFASDLSPDTFADNIRQDQQGMWQVARLPAEGDPMIRRVEDIKLRHYVYIDTVDEYYAALYDEMQPLYDLWRQYSREQILETREQGGSAGSGYSRGNFLALSQSYNRYKWAKIYEQEFVSLAQGFNNEVAPAILELNRRLRGLSGPVEAQYDQWRDILRQLFEVEIEGSSPEASEALSTGTL